MKYSYCLFALGLAFITNGCVSPARKPPENLLTLNDAQMASRSYQTRTFDVADEKEMLRGVMSALQDLGFIIERVNSPMGMVTAGKFGPEGIGFVTLTVVVRPKESAKSEVRTTALYNMKPIEDPKIYQNFFAAVGRALFGAQALAEVPAEPGTDLNPSNKIDTVSSPASSVTNSTKQQ